MPFALTNVTITYQQLMDKMFGAQLRRNLEVYVDDMFIKSNDLPTHIKDLEEVFGQLRKYNINRKNFPLSTPKTLFGV